jgi:ABC-type glycerol-3-phosphate transport system substrate-binding protein
MFFGGSWDISTIVQQAPTMDIKAFEFPNFVSGVKSTAFGGAGVAAATYGKINSSHRDLANKLVAYLASATADRQLLTGTAAISLPTVKSVKPPTSSALQTQLVGSFLPTESTFLDWYWPKQVVAVYQQDMLGVIAGTKTPEAASKDAQAAFVAAKAAGYSFN